MKFNIKEYGESPFANYHYAAGFGYFLYRLKTISYDTQVALEEDMRAT